MKKILLLMIVIFVAYTQYDNYKKYSLDNESDFLNKNEEIDNKPFIGYIVKINGNENYLIRSGEKTKLNKENLNNFIFEKDDFFTGKNSSLIFEMADRTKFTLSPNSRMSFADYKIRNINDRDILVTLKEGVLMSLFREKNKTKNMYIKAKNISLGVRGTEFITRILQDRVEVDLIEGFVDVLNSTQKLVQKMLAGDKKVYFFNKIDEMPVLEDTSLINNEKAKDKKVDNQKEFENTQIINPISKKQIIGKSEKINDINLNKNNYQKSQTNNSATKQQNNNSTQENENNSFVDNKINKERINTEKNIENYKINKISSGNTTNDDRYARIKSLLYDKKTLIAMDENYNLIFFDKNPEYKELIPKDINGNFMALKVNADNDVVGSVTISENGRAIPSSVYLDTTLRIIDENGNISTVNNLIKETTNINSQVVDTTTQTIDQTTSTINKLIP